MSGRKSAPRVLVVAYDFPPHGAIGTMRTLRVVRQLCGRGWQVAVLTGEPATYLPGTPIDSALMEGVPAGVEVIRAGAVRPWERLQRSLKSRMGSVRPAESGTQESGEPRTDGSPARRRGVVARVARAKDVVDAALAIPDRESGWLIPAIAAGTAARVRGFKPDVIYSSAPPWTGQLVAAALRQLLRRPWVADFRDPWARAPWRGDRYPFAMRAAARLERFVVRRADRIVFVTAGNRDDFAAHYGEALASKFEAIANGCDPSEFDALRGVAPPPNGPFVLLHAGSLYAGRTPVPLLNGVALAITRGTIDPACLKVRFLGANAMRAVDLPAVCRELGLESVVEFLPRVSRDESLRAMMTASALLLLQPGHTVSVPGKVYEYLATGRPILAIAEEGEISELMKRSGTGVFVRPDDEAGIADGLAEVMQLASRRLEVPGRELFDGNLGAARIAGILEGVVGGGGFAPGFAGAQG